MSKMSEEFRKALDQRAPTEGEARADLGHILDRSAGYRRKPSRWGIYAMAAVLGSTALFVGYRQVRQGRERDRGTGIPGQPIAGQADDIVIYVKKLDEDESQALSLTMHSQGEQ